MSSSLMYPRLLFLFAGYRSHFIFYFWFYNLKLPQCYNAWILSVYHKLPLLVNYVDLNSDEGDVLLAYMIIEENENRTKVLVRA